MTELSSWSQIAAYFTPGLTIKASLRKDGKFVSKTYHAPNGPADYVTDRIQTLLKSSEFADVVEETLVSTSPLHDCVMRFTTYDGCDARGFTNGLINVDGGTHLTATFAALKDALQPYANKKQTFTVNELKDGLVALINIKLSEPKFSSQTKEKLVDERGSELKAILQSAFEDWFKKNKKAALALVDRASRLKEMKTRFTASKQTLAALRKISKKGLPAVAATAPKCKPQDRELYILEGQSASGGMRFARFEKFQEFLPLRGKIRNLVSMDEKRLQSQTSEEVLNILAMLGVDPRAPDPVGNLRVGKIIVMADADPDGFHIQTLVFGVLFKYVPEVFERMMVYATRVPEFYSIVGNHIYSGDSLEEVQSLLTSNRAKGVVHHVKGYGEMDSKLLRLFACDSETRSLYRVHAKSFDRFELLMGSDSAPRKQLLGL
jgi:DNA gyrase subunit B